MAACHACGTEIDDRTRVYRTTLCPGCGRELKCCLNCRFYDPGAHWQCRETIPEEVRDKEKANFCDYFELRPSGEAGPVKPGAADEKAREARSKLDELFGNG
ncbi:MAG: hypothetical protein ACQETQ_00785 [Spirochaetota bacterium]